MTDVLVERFAALTDLRDDSDWLDVRRRARRARARTALLVATAAAALVAASAIAATSGWVFTSHDREVTARTTLSLAGRTWHVSYTTSRKHAASFCARASSSSSATHWNCREMGPGSPQLGPAFGGLKLTVPGGQIWAGATVGFARRISITDASGRVHTAQAVAAPKGTKTPFRYWVIQIDGSTARSITGRGTNDRSITKPLR